MILLEADKKEDPRRIVEAFKESENSELTGFKRLRIQNIQVNLNCSFFFQQVTINYFFIFAL